MKEGKAYMSLITDMDNLLIKYEMTNEEAIAFLETMKTRIVMDGIEQIEEELNKK